MADAMEMMILSILSPALHCDWWLNSWQQASITTVLFSFSAYPARLERGLGWAGGVLGHDAEQHAVG